MKRVAFIIDDCTIELQNERVDCWKKNRIKSILSDKVSFLLFNMNKIFIYIAFVFLFNVSTAKSQNVLKKDILSFEIESNNISLPGLHNEIEKYSYNSNILEKFYHIREYVEDSPLIDDSTLVQIKGEEKDDIINGVEFIINNLEKDSFIVYLSKRDKDSLMKMTKEVNWRKEQMYHLNYNNYLDYLSNKDSLLIDFREFNTEYSKQMDIGTQIDGAMWEFDLHVKLKNGKDLSYNYRAMEYIDDTLAKIFFIFRKAQEDFRLFKNINFDDLFSCENYYSLILRYVAYKENIIDRSKTVMDDYLK